MKIQKSILFLLAFALLGELKASKIEKAFEALGRYDYFGAKELFVKLKEKEPVASPYGLSIVFGRNDNPFFNTDSAHIYISIAEEKYPSADLKSKESLSKLGINDSTIAEWKDSIDWLAWKFAQEANTVESYQKFISRNTDASQLEEAIALRNELAFKNARAANSSRAYQVFIEKYPKADQVYEAQNRFEERLFEEATEVKSLLSYENFIKNHPESPFVNEAQDSIYSISTTNRSIETYEEFVRDYPNNPNVELAWRNIYKLYTAEYSPQRIIEFRIEYPNYPFLAELMTDMKLASKVFFPFKSNGKYGYMDETGEIMIQPNYDVVEPYSEGLGLVVKDGKVGFLNKAGDLNIPFEYEDGESFENGLAIVSKNESYGMIDRTNKTVVPLQYDLVGKYKSGLALIANDTAYGYVNKRGAQVVPLKLEYATDFDNGYAVIDQEGKKGIINTLGRLVVPAKYDWLENYNAYMVCRAKRDTVYGLIDNNGAEILPFEYDKIGEFGDSLALIAKNGKYGYVNVKGEIVIPLKYEFQTEALVWGKFENGTVKFMKKGKYGILDVKGNEVFAALFEDVGKYSKTELIAVKKRGKWGYSDQALHLALTYKYELSKTFENGRGKVKTEDGWQLIDSKGKFLLDSAYSEIINADSLLFVKSNHQWGILDREFKMVLPLQYDAIKPFQYRYLQITKNGEPTYFDPKFKMVIEPKL